MHTRSFVVDVTRNTQSHHCHSEGILARPGSLIQGNCSPIRDSTREPLVHVIPTKRCLSQLNAECFGCHSSQINTDTSFMCQRRYRVCAPCLRGGAIHCQEIASLCIENIRELNFHGSVKTAKIMRLDNLALYGSYTLRYINHALA